MIKLRRWYPVTNCVEYITCNFGTEILVGRDVDGHEIYTGDVVVGEHGEEVVVRLMDNLPPRPRLKEAQS